MIKKSIGLFLAVCMMVSLLTSCQTKAPQDDTTSDKETAQSSEGIAKTQDGKRVLTFNTNSFAAPQNVPGLAEAFTKWEEENNAVLEITVGVDDYLPKLLQDINAGNVQDVCFVDGSNLAEVNETGAMVSLDKWFTPEMQAEHYPYAIEGSTLDGEIKSVWFHGGLWNLYYRTDLLEEAGYSAPPKDWDELIEIGKALTVDEDGDGVIERYGLGIPAFPDAVTVCTLLPWYWGHGDGIELTNGRDKVIFNEGENLNAMVSNLGFIQTLMEEQVVSEDLASVQFTDVEANFVGGQTAMAILGNWHYPLMQESGGDEFMSKVGIADIPAVPGQNSMTVAGGWNIAMFCQDPEQQELAWSFMNFYRSAEVQSLLTGMGQMTSLLEVYEMPEFKDDPVMQSFAKGLHDGKTRDSVPFYSAVDEAYRQLIQSAATGEGDLEGVIQQEAEKAQAAADEIMK